MAVTALVYNIHLEIHIRYAHMLNSEAKYHQP